MTSECWAGFTDDDIQRMKSNPKTSKTCIDHACEIDGSKSKQRTPMKIKTSALKGANNDQILNGYENTNVERKVNQMYPNNEMHATNLSSDQDSGYEHPSFNSDDIEDSASNVHEKNGIEEPEPSHLVPFSTEEDDRCEEDMSSHSSLPPLEIFEMRQKRVEAENARRRALINKAINDKKMQTQAEAMKLAHITRELSRIDSNFSADVSILRDYIERASQEFSEAEKHYLKVEKEYVDAKTELFKRMQRKEMLTEHLCAIIEQNENRKANKLVELMKQLEMEVLTEDLMQNGIEPILSNLCMLNNESYHSCPTLKPSSEDHSQDKSEPEPVNPEQDTQHTTESQELTHTSKKEANSSDETAGLK